MKTPPKLLVLRSALAVAAIFVACLPARGQQPPQASVAIEEIGLRCPPAPNPDQPHTYTFELRNQTGSSASWIRLRAATGLEAIGPDAIRLSPPLATGESRLVVASLDPAAGNSLVEFDVELTDGGGAVLGGTQWRLTLPECDCIEIVSETFECLDADGTAFRYTAQIRNRSDFDLRHVLLLPLSAGTSFEGDHFPVALDVGSPTTAEISTTIRLSAPLRAVAFSLTGHDATLERCCAIPINLRAPCPGVRPRPQVIACHRAGERLALQLAEGDGGDQLEVQFSPDLRGHWEALPFAVSESGLADVFSSRGMGGSVFVDLPARKNGYFRVVLSP